MTTLCTLFGLLPLALGLGAGAELQKPLAIAVIGGASVSTLVTLVFVPASWSLAADRRPALDRARGESSYCFGFFLAARCFAGALFGAGSLVACSMTSRVANVRRPCSSKSITVWCSLTSTSVPGP